MAMYLIDYENVHDAGLDGVASLSEDDSVVIFYGVKIKAIPFDRHIEIMNSKAQVEYIKTEKIAKNYLDFQLSTYLGYILGLGLKGEVYVVSKDTGFDSLVDFWKGRNVTIDRVVNLMRELPATAEEAKAETKSKPKSKKSKVTKAEKKDKSAEANSNSKKKEKTSDADKNIKEQSKTVKEKTKAKKKADVKDMPEAFRKKIRAAVKKENLQATKYTAIYKAMLQATNHADYKNRLLQILGKETGESVYNHTQIIYSEYLDKA